MCEPSHRQYGLGQKQGKILIISRPPGGTGDQVAELLAIAWKRFPSLSRHLGSKAIEEDRGYGHYTIFGHTASAPRVKQ
jgi:hypothetical protein